ncbi:hypothetical protein BDQ17DRAFT_1434717 [Cyathus striatus]|nr:hypothetical protein BDQ17DRAFT_1434717 [Cyathus striatus]
MADGFSMEGTERLHIDLAKNGYNTSNKKDYTSQMAKWLQRQESIYHFGVYLQWAAPEYIMNSFSDEAGGVDEEKPTNDHDVVNCNDVNMTHMNEPYSIAKTAPFPAISVSDIMKDYGTADFLYYAEDFVQKNVDHTTPAIAVVVLVEEEMAATSLCLDIMEKRRKGGVKDEGCEMPRW